MMQRRPSARPGVLVSLAAALTLVASAALAHAFLVRASPASRATVAASPERVELTFNERIEPAYSTVSVWSGAGQQVDRRDAAVDARDGKRMSVGLVLLPPGEYVVRYRVLAVDGHVADASYRFTVRPRAPGL